MSVLWVSVQPRITSSVEVQAKVRKAVIGALASQRWGSMLNKYG